MVSTSINIVVGLVLTLNISKKSKFHLFKCSFVIDIVKEATIPKEASKQSNYPLTYKVKIFLIRSDYRVRG